MIFCKYNTFRVQRWGLNYQLTINRNGSIYSAFSKLLWSTKFWANCLNPKSNKHSACSPQPPALRTLPPWSCEHEYLDSHWVQWMLLERLIIVESQTPTAAYERDQKSLWDTKDKLGVLGEVSIIYFFSFSLMKAQVSLFICFFYYS